MTDRAAPPGGSAPRRLALRSAAGAMSYLAWEGAAASGAPDGRGSLLFTHATGFNAGTYRVLLGPLAGAFRIVAPDLRGHGASTLPADPARLTEWDTHRDDLLALIDGVVAAATLRPPLLLAGHSLGASLSLLVAAARPDWVAGLVLVEPVIMPYGYHWWLWLARRLGLRHRASPLAEMAERRRAVFDSRAAAFAGYRGRGAFRTWPDEVLRDYVEGGTRPRAEGGVELACAPAWEAANFRAQATYLWRRIARLRLRLRVPLHVLCGSVDSTFPPAVAKRFARLQPGARIDRVEGASHFLPMEAPQRVRAALLAMGDWAV